MTLIDNIYIVKQSDIKEQKGRNTTHRKCVVMKTWIGLPVKPIFTNITH